VYVVGAVALFAYSGGGSRFALLSLVDALLHTAGAMVVAAADADLGIFTKKHPRYAPQKTDRQNKRCLSPRRRTFAQPRRVLDKTRQDKALQNGFIY
jgi:hypothetical protein